MTSIAVPIPSGNNGKSKYRPYLSDAPKLLIGQSFREKVEGIARVGMHIAKTHGEHTPIDENSLSHEYYGHGDNFNIKYIESGPGSSKLEIMFNGVKSFSVGIFNSEINEVEVCSPNPKFIESLRGLQEGLERKQPARLRA